MSLFSTQRTLFNVGLECNSLKFIMKTKVITLKKTTFSKNIFSIPSNNKILFYVV